MHLADPQNHVQVLLSFRYYFKYSTRCQCTGKLISGVAKAAVTFAIIWTLIMEFTYLLYKIVCLKRSIMYSFS